MADPALLVLSKRAIGGFSDGAASIFEPVVAQWTLPTDGMISDPAGLEMEFAVQLEVAPDLPITSRVILGGSSANPNDGLPLTGITSPTSGLFSTRVPFIAPTVPTFIKVTSRRPNNGVFGTDYVRAVTLTFTKNTIPLVVAPAIPSLLFPQEIWLGGAAATGEVEISVAREAFDFDSLPGNFIRFHIIVRVTSMGSSTFLRFRHYLGQGVSWNLDARWCEFTVITAPGNYHLTVDVEKPVGLQEVSLVQESDGAFAAVEWAARYFEVFPE